MQKALTCFCDQSCIYGRLCVLSCILVVQANRGIYVQACLTLWPAWGLEQHSFSLLSIYQHNAARWDKWRQLLQYRMGSFGAWIINIFIRPFHFLFLCGVLCCCGRWHPAVGRALITHARESVTALCRWLWSAASTQSPGYNVLFMGNNQDLTSERVLKWYLWRGLSSAWKAFWKHLFENTKHESGYVFIVSSQEKKKISRKEAGVDFVMELNGFL